MSACHWLDLGTLKMSTDYAQKSPWTLCQVHECHVICIRSYFDETRTRSLSKYNTPFELALFLLSCKISPLWRGIWKPGTNTGLSDKWAPWLVGWVTFGLRGCFGDPYYAFACNKCLFICTNCYFQWVGGPCHVIALWSSLSPTWSHLPCVICEEPPRSPFVWNVCWIWGHFWHEVWCCR
jgi:hypothetical protein